MLANQQRPDRDVLNVVIVPGLLLLILYILLDSSATAAIGWPWKFGYAVALFLTVSYLIRKLLVKWRLSQTERAKFVEGFLAGAFASLIGMGGMFPIDPVWVAVGTLVFGFSFGYFISGLWSPSSTKGPDP